MPSNCLGSALFDLRGLFESHYRRNWSSDSDDNATRFSSVWADREINNVNGGVDEQDTPNGVAGLSQDGGRGETHPQDPTGGDGAPTTYHEFSIPSSNGAVLYVYGTPSQESHDPEVDEETEPEENAPTTNGDEGVYDHQPEYANENPDNLSTSHFNHHAPQTADSTNPEPQRYVEAMNIQDEAARGENSHWETEEESDDDAAEDDGSMRFEDSRDISHRSDGAPLGDVD
ncbi:hypothetical protein P152DRAFT_455683 [Eremomyces bilateralis CBS 781.70]|uniref:Uncharacterized protein n=1 Tax=Eremomyces bilateralis CBS 781.70 TaxID=1392243 RepID=A0A6G1GDH3_9PEZI|nr:uncharacterized protein P152DRAFT_455683 [Eremomyces bilateralis CBS 781.70]KAF1815960.1 hypothetical protein P152DRAFT_455683 [Eremomyces bilateralis CBS 781.70]